MTYEVPKHVRGPSQLGKIPLLSLSLNPQGASKVANPGVAQNWVSSRENFNPRSSEARKAAQDLQVAQFRGPKVAPIEVFPREYFILSSFRIPTSKVLPKLQILELLRIEFLRGKTSIRRHPEIITNCGFRNLLRMKYSLGITSIWATLCVRNWPTLEFLATLRTPKLLRMKKSLGITSIRVTLGFSEILRIESRITRIEVFPREYFNPSASGILRNAQNWVQSHSDWNIP